MKAFFLFLIAMPALQPDANLLVNALTTPLNRIRQRRAPVFHLESSAVAASVRKDYSSEAAGLFGNVRIPAALFAGAAAGAAFALPLGVSEGSKVGLVKRLYALLMMGSLSSEIVAVVVSTLTLGALSTQDAPRSATSLRGYLGDYYDLEWISAKLHFLGGVLLFSVATGLRAWITIGCPIIARAALGIILSSTLLWLSFWRQLEDDSFLDGVTKLPVRYVGALWQRSKRSGMFAASLALTIVTTFYIFGNILHLYQYFSNP